MCFLCAGAAVAAAAGAGQIPVVAARAAHEATGGEPLHYVAKWVRPVLCTIPFIGLNVYSYGVCIAAALLLAVWVLERELLKAEIELDIMHCFFTFLIGFGVGSKSHVALSAFMTNGEPITWKAMDIRTGHSFMGSIIGAVGATLILVKWNRVPVLRFLDCLLPCCLLGHTIGKVGCLLSGDGCYGPPADPKVVWWAMSFPNAADPTRVPVHPTPIYEGTLSFLVFAFALAAFPLPRPRLTDGRRTAVVLILYGIERVCIEPFRRHPPIEVFMGLTEYQALAVVMLIIGALIELTISVAEQTKTEQEGTEGESKKSKQQKKKD